MTGSDLFVTPPEEELVDFDWSSPDLEVIPEQPQTAVYLNGRGQLVIRQLREIYDTDPFCFFERDRVPRLIAMIQKVIARG